MLPKIHIQIEKWKFNKNYQLYVSNLGNFKDKSKEDIKLKVEKGGYLVLPVCNNKKGIIKYLFAHRVVMETWCPRADMWKEKLTVDHLNHNKRNNTVKNLEWVSDKVNLSRAAEDMAYDDKDKYIQSLKDKIRQLEVELERCQSLDLSITAVGVKNFKSWKEVKSFLTTKNPNYCHAHIKTVQKNIMKSFNSGTKYCGYNWKIINY